MNKIILALLMVLIAACGELRAQQAGQFGAGVIAGRPIGLTAKYWLNDTQAFDAGLGFGDHLAFYGDFLWHAWNILPQPKAGKLGVYAGLGPLIRMTDDTTFGIRTMFGIDYWISGHPIELFAEAGPVFHVTPNTDVSANGGVGIRIYFNGSTTDNSSRKR